MVVAVAAVGVGRGEGALIACRVFAAGIICALIDSGLHQTYLHPICLAAITQFFDVQGMRIGPVGLQVFPDISKTVTGDGGVKTWESSPSSSKKHILKDMDRPPSTTVSICTQFRPPVVQSLTKRSNRYFSNHLAD